MRLKRINPYDYLHGSARVRMLRNKIVTKGKLYQIIDAPNLRQAFRVLNSCGIGVGENPENYEAALVREHEETYGIVREITKGLQLFDVFRYGYDGLNLKITLKARAAGRDPLREMTNLGTVPKNEIIEGLNKKLIPGLPLEMKRAAEEAQTALASANDSQMADILIDKGMLSAMYRIVHEYNNAFFQKVVRSRIDVENIRSFVRIKRAGRDVKFLERVLSEGGYIENKRLISVFSGGIRGLAVFIGNSQYGTALSRAFDGLEASGRLTHFEKLCDNYMLSFIGEANRFVFGIEPILGYILEKENEITSVRMVMASKMINIPANTIIERLREYA